MHVGLLALAVLGWQRHAKHWLTRQTCLSCICLQISGDDEGVDRTNPAMIAFESALGFGNQAVLDNFRKEFK
jgi:hypothetical protein